MNANNCINNIRTNAAHSTIEIDSPETYRALLGSENTASNVSSNETPILKKYFTNFSNETPIIRECNPVSSKEMPILKKEKKFSMYLRISVVLIFSFILLLIVLFGYCHLITALITKSQNSALINISLNLSPNSASTDLSTKNTKIDAKGQEFGFEKFSYTYTTDDENVEKYPWLVRFVYEFEGTNEYACTGNIIFDDTILTAAHCFGGNITEIHIGGTSKKNYTDIIKIPRSLFNLIEYPEYNMNNYNNIVDIGLIKLKNIRLKFSNSVYPIALPIDEPKLPYHFTMNIWSSNDLEDFNRTEKIETIVDSEKCHELYMTKGHNKDLTFRKDGINYPMIFCANHKDYVPQGNSGSAIFVKQGKTPIAYGLLSFGDSESYTLPNVYVDIRFHLEWIYNNTQS